MSAEERSVVNHLSKQHPNEHKFFSVEAYKTWKSEKWQTEGNPPCLSDSFLDSLVSLRKHIPMEGLAVVSGKQCTACGSTKLAASMKGHTKKCPAEKNSTVEIVDCDMQLIHHPSGNGDKLPKYIRVDSEDLARFRFSQSIPDSEDFSQDELMDLFNQFIETTKISEGTRESNWRTVSPFYVTVRWHVLPERNVCELAAYSVSSPGNSKDHDLPGFEKLRAACHHFLKSETERGVNLNAKSRKILMIHSPDVETSERPFYLISPEAIERYCSTLVRFIAMIVRRSCASEIYAPLGAMPENIVKAARKFHNELLLAKHRQSPDLKNALAELILQTMRERDESGVKREDCFVVGQLVKFASYKVLDKAVLLVPPTSITPLTAALMYSLRLALCSKLLDGDPNNPLKSLVSLIYNEDKASTIPIEALCLIHGLAAKCSTHGNVTIGWNDSETLVIRGDIVRLETIKKTCQVLIGRARDQLEKLLFGNHKLMDCKSIVAEHIFDNVDEKKDGYWFLSDPRNASFTKNALVETLKSSMGSPHWQQRIFCRDQNKKAAWSRAAFERYENDLAAFMSTLFTLIHLTAGLPPRAEEHTATLLMNSGYRMRSVFWFKNTFMIIQRYAKAKTYLFLNGFFFLCLI